MLAADIGVPSAASPKQDVLSPAECAPVQRSGNAAFELALEDRPKLRSEIVFVKLSILELLQVAAFAADPFDYPLKFIDWSAAVRPGQPVARGTSLRCAWTRTRVSSRCRRRFERV
jgi:hypothetical protein